MTGRQWRLTDRIEIGLPPDEAFRLFTPRGEQDWADGWEPRFPVPVPDDTEPGTVFETGADEHYLVWLVTGREPGRRMSYARIAPGEQAGTVTVTLTPSGAGSAVEVTYQLTALSEAAEARLSEFADGYPAFLRSWQGEIEAWQRGGSEG